MSLLLRKDFQDVLDKIPELVNLHASINKNKQLELVTECGKSVVTIQGIKFTKLSPTHAERAYAIELFQAFINKHFSLLCDYLTLLYKVKNRKEIQPPKLFNKSDSWSSQYSYEDSEASYFIKGNSLIIKPKSWETYKVNQSILKCVKQYFKDKEQYDNEDTVLSELIKKLMSCDI